MDFLLLGDHILDHVTKNINFWTTQNMQQTALQVQAKNGSHVNHCEHSWSICEFSDAEAVYLHKR